MMKQTMSLLVAGMLAVGCMPEVVDQNDGRSGSNLEGNEESSSSSSSGGTQTHDAVAMTRAQLDVLWDEYWQQQGGASGSSSSSGGGGGLNPDDLFIRISDLGATCSSPTTELSCGGHWQVSIALPPAYQAPGIYDLEDVRISSYSSMSETGQLYSADPDDCAFGGGSLGTGTIEVLSTTESEIELVLTMDTFFESDPSGTYKATICAQ
jgi:hypothetical protein